MNMKGHIRLAAVVVALLLGACAPLQPQRPGPISTHVLDAHIETPTAAGTRTQTLVVATPRAAPGYDSVRIAYTRHPHEIEYFANNEWVAPPAHMLAPLIVRTLEQGGGFRAVVPASSPVIGDLRLDTEIVRLQQEFDVAPSRVRFTLRAQLVDPVARRVVKTGEFDAIEDAPGDDPRGGVAAANRAVARVLAELAGFCSGQ